MTSPLSALLERSENPAIGAYESLRLVQNSGIKNNSLLNYPIDILSHNFIRLGLTHAKALQTVSRFPRETRRRYATPKSNALTLRKHFIIVIKSPENILFPGFIRSKPLDFFPYLSRLFLCG